MSTVVPVILLCDSSQARNGALRDWSTLWLTDGGSPYSLLAGVRAGPSSVLKGGVFLIDLTCLDFELLLSFYL